MSQTRHKFKQSRQRIHQSQIMKQPGKDKGQEGKGRGDDFKVIAEGRGMRKKEKEQREEGEKQPQETGRRALHLSNMWVGCFKEAQVGWCQGTGFTKGQDEECFQGKSIVTHRELLTGRYEYILYIYIYKYYILIISPRQELNLKLYLQTKEQQVS